MKIALVCPYNIGRGGGVLEIIKDLRSAFVDHGHSVLILTPQPREPLSIDTEGVVFLGGGTEFRSPTHTTLQVSASVDTEAIAEVLDKEKFDVIHFHEPWVPVLSRQILSRSEAVNIATFHGVVPETVMSRTVIRVVTPYALSILKYLDELTAVSDAAAEYIRSLTDRAVKIIPNGIDLNRYHPALESKNSDNKTKTVLYIGRLEKRKGVKYLIQSFALLEKDNPELELVIAGDGPDRERLELLCEDLKLKNVHFIGYVDDARKIQLLQNADLFCSPAVYGESFGLVLLEAMATATVTIAGNNSGYDALMRDLGQLSIVNPHDAAELARRMLLMLNNVPLRKLWVEWAQEYVQQFDYPRVIEQYEKLYEDALRKHRR